MTQHPPDPDTDEAEAQTAPRPRGISSFRTQSVLHRATAKQLLMPEPTEVNIYVPQQSPRNRGGLTRVTTVFSPKRARPR